VSLPWGGEENFAPIVSPRVAASGSSVESVNERAATIFELRDEPGEESAARSAHVGTREHWRDDRISRRECGGDFSDAARKFVECLAKFFDDTVKLPGGLVKLREALAKLGGGLARLLGGPEKLGERLSELSGDLAEPSGDLAELRADLG
jgi:hypothetical protein